MSDPFPPLTQADAVAIGRIVQAARDAAPLLRLVNGRSVRAEARAIVRSEKEPYVPDAAEDVRGAVLWVTLLDTGTEQWWPLSELVPELTETAFAIYQRPEPLTETIAAAQPPLGSS